MAVRPSSPGRRGPAGVDRPLPRPPGRADAAHVWGWTVGAVEDSRPRVGVWCSQSSSPWLSARLGTRLGIAVGNAVHRRGGVVEEIRPQGVNGLWNMPSRNVSSHWSAAFPRGGQVIARVGGDLGKNVGSKPRGRTQVVHDSYPQVVDSVDGAATSVMMGRAAADRPSGPWKAGLSWGSVCGHAPRIACCSGKEGVRDSCPQPVDEGVRRPFRRAEWSILIPPGSRVGCRVPGAGSRVLGFMVSVAEVLALGCPGSGAPPCLHRVGGVVGMRSGVDEERGDFRWSVHDSRDSARRRGDEQRATPGGAGVFALGSVGTRCGAGREGLSHLRTFVRTRATLPAWGSC